MTPMPRVQTAVLSPCLATSLLLGTIGSSPGSPVGSSQFHSADTKTALLELYTSEGCSSCPPADRWFSQLKHAPGLWKDFVPVSFHVDYWNYLGWRDPWSKSEFTTRQQTYARRWRSESVYTPAVVLDGKEWHALDSHPAAAPFKPGPLVISELHSNRWTAQFTPASRGQGPFEIHLALLVSGVSVDVKAGENSGRHLVHDFVAVAIADVPMVRREDSWQATLSIHSPPLPPGREAGVAAWVTRVGEIEPVQATGGWLRVASE
jgi:hypothetical protein